MAIQGYRELLIENVDRSLALIPISAEDTAAMEAALSDGRPAHAALFEKYFIEAIQSSTSPTAGYWANFLRLFIAKIGYFSADAARAISVYRITAQESACCFTPLLDSAVEVAVRLSDTEIDFSDRPEELSLGHACFDHAKVLLDLGEADLAYNLASMAMDILRNAPDFGEPVGRFALALAEKAKRKHQIATCAFFLAHAVRNAAVADPTRRAEAFALSEIAVSRLEGVEEPFRRNCLDQLWRLFDDFLDLRPLLLTLLRFYSKDERVGLMPPDADVSEIYALSRFEDEATQTWKDRLPAELNFLSLVDDRWFDLTAEDLEASVSADWITRTIQHPAIFRCVPHNRSFLRDRSFGRHLLQLSHEVAHAITLNGGLGWALTALRTALYRAEMGLWGLDGVDIAQGEFMEAFVAQEGLAPRRGSCCLALRQAEICLELAAKAQILQDVWTPWFEGIAVYAETAADPQRDRHTDTVLTRCLRNLVDFNPGEAFTSESLAQAHGAFVEDFDAATAETLQQGAKSHLEAVLRTENAVYFAGYIAVRSVVSAWRQTHSVEISGSMAFNLLQHTARFGTYEDAIPDLSLPSEEFRVAAHHMMQRWVSGLAGLPAEDLAYFFKPPDPDTREPTTRYRKGRIQPSDTTPARDMELFLELGRRQQREAQMSLMTEHREQVGDPPDVQHVVAVATEGVKTLHALHSDPESDVIGDFGVMSRGFLLPIGQTDALFHINVDPDTGDIMLGLSLRTTEVHVETGRSSYNSFARLISAMDLDEIRRHWDETGVPRLKARRIVDINGIVYGSSEMAGMHFLTLEYGDWFFVTGANRFLDQLLQSSLAEHPVRKDWVRERVLNHPARQAEIEVVARGHEGASRTLAWVQNQDEWVLGDQPVAVSLRTWTDRVAAKATGLLDDDAQKSARLNRQRDCAADLLQALLCDENRPRAVARDGFDDMTSDVSYQREEVIEAFFRTGIAPDTSEWLDAAKMRIVTGETGLFHKHAGLWDIVPAPPRFEDET